MMTGAPLDRLFTVLGDLVDARVGVIAGVREVATEAGAPNFFHIYAEAGNTLAFTNQKNFNISGGASADRGLAMAKAIGEAVERYCSAIFDQAEFPLYSYDSAPFQCVAPSDFALYSNEQYVSGDFPFVRFGDSTLVRWCPAVDAATKEPWYVPASMVYMPYFFDQQNGEQAIGQRMSTGLACHCSFAEAAVSAICEVVERDAFTITWQTALGMPQITHESLSARNRDLVARFERTGSELVLLNLTLDHGIPTILGVLRSEAEEAPALVFAASSDPDPEKAVRKSLEELAHTRRLAQQLKRQQPRFVPAPGFTNIKTQDDHVHLYTDLANARLADFIFDSAVSIAFQEIPSLTTGDAEADLKVLVEKVRAVDHRVLLADITTPDVVGLGLHVVRAIIPGFHPLFMGHHLRALGGTRLWDVPQKLGYRGITKKFGDNLAPHPYP